MKHCARMDARVGHTALHMNGCHGAGIEHGIFIVFVFFRFVERTIHVEDLTAAVQEEVEILHKFLSRMPASRVSEKSLLVPGTSTAPAHTHVLPRRVSPASASAGVNISLVKPQPPASSLTPLSARASSPPGRTVNVNVMSLPLEVKAQHRALAEVLAQPPPKARNDDDVAQPDYGRQTSAPTHDTKARAAGGATGTFQSLQRMLSYPIGAYMCSCRHVVVPTSSIYNLIPALCCLAVHMCSLIFRRVCTMFDRQANYTTLPLSHTHILCLSTRMSWIQSCIKQQVSAMP